MSLRRGEGECLYLSLVQGYRWKEIILHSVHRPNNLLKHLLVARVIYHLNLHTNTQLILIRLNSGTMRVWTKNSQSVSQLLLFVFFTWQHLSHPYAEESADGFVVTGFQLHVTPIFELLDIVSSPQDPVTPSRDTALPAAADGHSFRGKVKSSDTYGTADSVLATGRCHVIRMPNKKEIMTKKKKRKKKGTSSPIDPFWGRTCMWAWSWFLPPWSPWRLSLSASECLTTQQKSGNFKIYYLVMGGL